MSQFTESYDYPDDRHAFVAAAAAYARADEQQSNLGSHSWLTRCALRSEALAVASLEGHLVRPEALCRLLGSRDTTRLDRGTRLAADLFDALSVVSSLGGEPPPAEGVRRIFEISDRSSGRVSRPDLVWTLEEDSSWLSDQLASLAEKPDPWAAAEVLRAIWTSGRFHSSARRMAMLVAPWIVAKGFHGELALTGVAVEIVRDLDSFRDASTEGVRWSGAFAGAVAAASAARHGLSGRLLGTKATLLALCPAERSSSSVGAAVEYMIGTPVFTVRAFCDELGLTPRGAKVVLDKLEEAGALDVEGGLRNRNYVCRRCL